MAEEFVGFVYQSGQRVLRLLVELTLGEVQDVLRHICEIVFVIL